MGQLVKTDMLFLSVLEAETSKIKVPADLLSGEDLFPDS